MVVSLFSAFDIIRLSPFLYFLTLPLYGAFCGTDACCRLSLLLCLYTLITSVIPTNKPLLSLLVNGISLACLLVVPVSTIPSQLTTFYHLLLWMSQIPLLFLDCSQLVHTSMTFSYTIIIDYMDDAPQLYKSFMLIASLLCYVVAGIYAYFSWYTNGHALYWLLFVVLLLLFTAHCFMYTFEEGIITDVAVISASSLIMLHMFYHNASYVRSPLEVPDTWFRLDVLKLSSVEIFYKMTNYNVEQAKLSVLFLVKMLSPGFLFLFLLRLWSIICTSIQIYVKYNNELPEDMNTLEKIVSCRPLLNLSIVFIYTQSIISHLYICTSSVWAYYLSSTTIIQAIVLPLLYMYRLYRVETSGWNLKSQLL